MYWEHFGFSEPPFALTPNPHFLFLSSRHQEAFAHLLYAIDARAGFIELSGEVGTGKTTIIRTLLNQLDPETHRSALIFNPTLSPIGLLQAINRELRLPSTGSEISELLETLNAFLLEENRAGRAVVLVIDEAQNLSIEVLEQIRLISNLETERAKLIQVVLVGQPELKTLLAKNELRQLDQRITVHYHLEPMGLADTRTYIRHRISVAAGGREPLSFSNSAVKRIYRFSGGIPRLINGVCDRALLLAYTKEARTITPAMASLAIADMRKGDGPPSLGPRFTIRATLIALAVAAVGAVAFSRYNNQPPARTTVKQSITPLTRESTLEGLAAAPEQENRLAAANAILKAWQMPAATVGAGAMEIRSIARQRGLTATEVTGTLDSLARLDTPALLRIPLPGGGSRLLALVSIDRNGATIAPAVNGRSSLTRPELAAVWTGNATLLWKNFHDISPRLKTGSRGKGVKQLQELLKGAGHYDGTVSGVFDPMTDGAIRTFQRAEGLAADGKPGEQTLLLLYRRAGGFFPPGFSQYTGQQQPNTELNGGSTTILQTEQNR
ncbi:AAA family ATPase [Geobacter argillaceus]|uniref:General secretion pathway protein A n=1 Tax=Geobacter argillaceus TaxID=345631 RepID=A0A562VMB9_9BACT|nr:AAA family ATPase [Geobacter argillaceus]TWJ18962.1 general secretion pathway protein A [Geobacter argillaceus]